MALVNLLLLALAIIALVFQLITPLVLNLPAAALILIGLIMAVRNFRRRRESSRLPFFAGLNLLLQTCFFILSVAIITVITIPNESPEDSPAVVQGIRRFLASQGWLDQPRTVTLPQPAAPASESTADVNAPDPGKVEIKIDGDEKNTAPPAGENP